MATLGELASPDKGVRTSEAHFFWIMAVIMSAIIVAGFSVNLVLGRSTFAVPLAYHVHAVVFFGWVALYLAQNGLVATNNIRLHRTLGLLAYPLAPRSEARRAGKECVSSCRSRGSPDN